MAKKNISGDPSTIGRTIRIQGSLEGDEDLRLLGKIEGDLDLNAHHLIIGEGAQVDGNVRGHAITVEGHVSGTIESSELLYVQATGSVSGDAHTPRLMTEDGARLNGRLVVGSSTGGAGPRIPDFDRLRRLVQSELRGLTDQQLDFSSKSPDWARWSIRRQVSHMANSVYFWLVGRWKDILWDNVEPDPELAEIALAEHGHDRMLDPSRYRDIQALFKMLNRSYDLIHEVAGRESVHSIREKKLTLHLGPDAKVGASEESAHQLWERFGPLHEGGIARDPSDSLAWTFTLEATLRHLYYEQLSHLRTIQRLKKKQGLPAVARVPQEGYLQFDGFWND